LLTSTTQERSSRVAPDYSTMAFFFLW
jgi:hypothetical protein